MTRLLLSQPFHIVDIIATCESECSCGSGCVLERNFMTVMVSVFVHVEPLEVVQGVVVLETAVEKGVSIWDTQ